jgi:acylphosphatase
MSERKCVHVIISGEVQGVGFRAWTMGRARELQLEGWVRNLRNGTVEAAFKGDAPQVEAMLAACLQGPPAAIVSGVEAHDCEDNLASGKFDARPTV